MSTKEKRKTIVIAAGGTGGHLFPAQALADQILAAHPHVDLLFIGAQLTSNPYFNKECYSHYQVDSATPFKRNVIACLKSWIQLFKGLKQSVAILKKEKPDLVIGFGSFHCFPVLCAAFLKKHPLVLFESNTYPGKVNRLFASVAQFTAIVFAQTKQHLKGKMVEVVLPIKQRELKVSAQAARSCFGLDPLHSTLLIFGGSQGAIAMNQRILEALEIMKAQQIQIIHIVGNTDAVEPFRQAYARLKIRACVKPFESNMPLAYQAASLAICRSGAATVSELIDFQVPAILIPFPRAADDHQTKNAQFLCEEVGGAMYFSEKQLIPTCLANALDQLLDPMNSQLEQMKSALSEHKKNQSKEELWMLVGEIIK